MAILIHAKDIESYFKLDSISKYILEAIREDSPIYKRILSLSCECGRVEQKFSLGDDIVAIEQSYKLDNNGLFESHKKYVDFQLVLDGSECMKIGFQSSFSNINSYDSTKDVINYTSNEAISSLSLYPNNLLVLFPEDIHAGGFRLNHDIVFKSVLKVPLSKLRGYGA